MITQTNRTILFDVINPEIFNLSNLMTGTEENISSLTDEKIVEINKALLVSSFDEFLEKFKPTIYSYFDTNNVPQHSLVRPTGIPKEFIKEIKIDKNNRVLKMFTQMMDIKKKSNKTNVNFDYEEVTKMLAPEKALKEMQKIKMEIKYLEGQNASLEKDSPAKADAVKNLLTKYDATRTYYNETGAQLALAAGMLKEALLLEAKVKSKGEEKAQLAVPVFENGEITSLITEEEYKERMQLKAAESADEPKLLSGDTSSVEYYEENTVTTLVHYYNKSMEKIYKDIGKEGEYDPEKGKFHRDLVLAAFTDNGGGALMELSTESKVEKYNYFTRLHASWEKSFIREAKVLIEKLLNIKSFFDQYTPKSPKMKPTLLIVNSRLEDIVEESYLKQLQQYLESVNNKLECTDTIWFGIVPDIQFSEESDDDDSDDEKIEEVMKAMGYTGDFDIGTKIAPNKMMYLTALLDGIKKYKIQTFFSFEATDDTTFSRLATHGVDTYIEKTQDIVNNSYNRFAIACLPNFTIMPRDRSKVVYGAQVTYTEKTGVEFSKDREEQYKFWIYGIYVSAAFVAAGITAACQCPSYLATRFDTARAEKKIRDVGKISKDLPGVRFDLEAANHSEIVTTTFAKEIAGITNDDRQKLNNNNFGFVFSSDKSGNVVVFKARSLYQKDDVFVSLFKETTNSYILRMLRFLSGDKRANVEKEYAPGGQVKKWELVKGYANSILGDADSIGVPATEDGNTQIEVKFGGTSEYINLEIITE